MDFNYPQLCQNLLKDLPSRQKEVILRRFGLETNQRETLQSIGENYGITRERVRQIETDGISRIKPRLEGYQKIFQHLSRQLRDTGNLRREEILLDLLGGPKFQNHLLFLLTLAENFERFPETKDFHSLWTIDRNSLTSAQKVIDFFYGKLIKINQPVCLEGIKFPAELLKIGPRGGEKRWLEAYLEISKKIDVGPEGLFGLRDWPEINPRGVKDKAYLVFKKEKRPLHFTEVANFIGGNALPQTVHNELIKDPRFVLVGRGIYALKEWGYISGVVKDIIFKVLKEAQKPLSKEEILEKVLKQRLVKENTILLNLSNKKYFKRDSQRKFTIANFH